jgi:Inner membrane component of T3SS, cytoplasmic domain
MLTHLFAGQRGVGRELSRESLIANGCRTRCGSGCLGGRGGCYAFRMQAACGHCGTQHLLKEADLGDHPKVQFRCSKCGQNTVVELRRQVDNTVVIMPLPSFARAEGMHSSLQRKDDYAGLSLPRGCRIMLTVLAGPSKGTVLELTKPRATLGREGSDLALEDPEVSRHHCLLEVRDTAINLKDLDSTNGTFFEDVRVRAAFLVNGAEFRIGTSLIRVALEPK